MFFIFYRLHIECQNYQWPKLVYHCHNTPCMFLLFPTLIFLYSKQRYLADKTCLNEPPRRQSKFLMKDAYRFLAPTFWVFLSHLVLIRKPNTNLPRPKDASRMQSHHEKTAIWYCIARTLVLYYKKFGIVLQWQYWYCTAFRSFPCKRRLEKRKIEQFWDLRKI